MLTDAQVERYSRQIVLPEIGGTGQERLLTSSIILHGLGWLADQTAAYLARAGVGRVALTDAENRALQDESPDCVIEAIAGLRPDEGRFYHLVIDTTGSATVLATVNREALQWRCPLIWAQAYSDHAMVAMLAGHRSTAPCAECVRDRLPLQTVTTNSGFASATGLWAAGYVAAEVMRCLLDPDTVVGSLTIFDPGLSVVTTSALAKQSHCPTCRA